MTSTKERVQRGAALLDKVQPDWPMRVADLQMYSDCDCVLGQVFGSYTQSVYELYAKNGYDYRDAIQFSMDHGFTITRSDTNWSVLQNHWITEIYTRDAGDESCPR